MDNLLRPITRKLKKRKIYSSFRYNICGADLAGMKSISKYNKGVRFLLLNVIDIYSKYVWVAPLKDRKGIAITDAFMHRIFFMSLVVNQTKYG